MGGLTNRKDYDMTIIGNFSRDGDSYTGIITTLALKTTATIKPNSSKTVENAPDYRIFAAGAEIGAAWSKKSEANKPYLSIKLDDPSFAQAILCRLVTNENGAHRLLWSR